MIVEIKDDFDLKKIAESGQCFRPCEVEDGVYRFIYRDNVLFIKNTNPYKYEISCDEATWNDIWFWYFDLDRNYKKIRKQIPKEDEFLLKASKLGEGIRILNQDSFEMLLSFIISQRKSIPAIKSSVEKICSFYGKEVQTEYGSAHLFPTTKDFIKNGFEKLSDCSLGYRLPYITEAIENIHSGLFSLESVKELSDEDLLEYLMKFKGVGIKVASCVALFAYKRGAIAPVDVWINRVIDDYYGGASPYPSYGDNSGIYQQYAFYYQTN